jgi:rod shape-determining protein MreD
MAYIISVPVMVVVLMIQLAVVGQLPLLYGTGDLVLLTLVAWSLQERSQNAWFWALVGGGLVSLISALPFGAPLILYLVIVLVVRLVNRQMLEFPILGMLIVTIVATFFQHLCEVILLFVDGRPLPFSESIVLVTLPSVLLNLLFAVPIYALIHELALWVNPIEVKI